MRLLEVYYTLINLIQCDSDNQNFPASHHPGAKISQDNAPEILLPVPEYVLFQLNRYANETHGTLCGSQLTAPKNPILVINRLNQESDSN